MLFPLQRTCAEQNNFELKPGLVEAAAILLVVLYISKPFPPTTQRLKTRKRVESARMANRVVVVCDHDAIGNQCTTSAYECVNPGQVRRMTN